MAKCNFLLEARECRKLSLCREIDGLFIKTHAVELWFAVTEAWTL